MTESKDTAELRHSSRTIDVPDAYRQLIVHITRRSPLLADLLRLLIVCRGELEQKREGYASLIEEIDATLAKVSDGAA